MKFITVLPFTLCTAFMASTAYAVCTPITSPHERFGVGSIAKIGQSLAMQKKLKQAQALSLQQLPAPEIMLDARSYEVESASIGVAHNAKRRMAGSDVVENMPENNKLSTNAASVIVYPNTALNDSLNTSREKYQQLAHNKFLDPALEPLSTFSTDVDVASFANVRRIINQGTLPPVGAVRTEEFINYFDYQYPQPMASDALIGLDYELTKSPWNTSAKLLKIVLQAQQVENRKGSNLVFLIDVSDSMSSASKLPLLKKSLNLLTAQLTKNDCVAIVTYAGQANVALNSTLGSAKAKIKRVINDLQAGGGTNGGNGLELAYQLASTNFIDKGANRILLATDGDFNLGMQNPTQMKRYIEKKRQGGVSLSVLGFGEGNYNDHLMEELSNAGNGNAAYIDNLQEAQKVLVQQLKSNIITVAYDAKLQVEFNPRVIKRYRLLGYENRLLKQEDFKNDAKDAGDIGAGQSVTAIYEIFYNTDDMGQSLRYQSKLARKFDVNGEIGFVKMRYKKQHNTKSIEYNIVLEQKQLKSLEQSSVNFKLAIAVAAYAEKLRQSSEMSHFKWQQIIDLAVKGKGDDLFGYRSAFIQQLRLTKLIDKS
ncbi:MAG: von Willebrand factor type A domain-containing protein [Oceanospirillaceae bacterium]